MSTGTNGNEPRILIVGSSSDAHPKTVKACDWRALSDGTVHLPDHNVVFLDLSSAGSATLLREDIARFLLGTFGTLWLIGNPATSLGDGQTFSGADLLPFRLRTQSRQGVGVTKSTDGQPHFRHLDDFRKVVGRYVSSVEHYSWFALDNNPHMPDDSAQFALLLSLGYAQNRSDGYGAAFAPLAQNNAGNAVACVVEVWRTWSNFRATVVFLPTPTKCDAATGINLLLADGYGIARHATEPGWLASYELPFELPPRQAIAGARAQIAALEAQIMEQQRLLDVEHRFGGLLYEQGEDVLEPIVRDALNRLGAEAAPPQVRGEHDGRAVDPNGREYVLEIKGRTGAMKKSDAAQAAGHVTAVRVEEGKDVFGLFIANAYCNEHPAERKTEPFEPNGMGAIRNAGLRVLKTTQLFEALRRDQQRQLNRTDFWERVFSADPLADLPEPGLASEGERDLDAQATESAG